MISFLAFAVLPLTKASMGDSFTEIIVHLKEKYVWLIAANFVSFCIFPLKTQSRGQELIYCKQVSICLTSNRKQILFSDWIKKDGLSESLFSQWKQPSKR